MLYELGLLYGSNICLKQLDVLHPIQLIPLVSA